jgi:hypothetical protein
MPQVLFRGDWTEEGYVRLPHGTSAPCDPVTPTINTIGDQRGFEVDSWLRPFAKRNSRLWLFI